MKYRWILLFVLVLIFFGIGVLRVNKLFGAGRKDSGIQERSIKGLAGRNRLANGPGDYHRKIRFNWKKRFYKIHVPPQYNKSTPTSVVVVCHGGGGNPDSARHASNMDETADREGFIVVYPAGSSIKWFLKDRLLIWNDGRPYKDGTQSKINDVGYIEKLLDELQILFNVDTKRVYACGYSNGAQFTYRLAKRTDRFAAIALIAGQRPAHDPYDPPPSRPISIMQFMGVEDKIGMYYGGSTPPGAGLKGVAKPVTAVIESWVEFNQCSHTPVEVKRIGKAVLTRYGSGQDGAEVAFWKLEDGGHTWPGGGEADPRAEKLGLGKMGHINRDINASDLMWEFFRKHTLN